MFARHGYVFLFLFRSGVGLSRDQGKAGGDLMDRAAAEHGAAGRNRVQLELLETEEMDQARAGLSFLRTRPDVDSTRVAVVGHSFGGALALLLGARDSTLRAIVVFAGGARSWPRSPRLRARLERAAAGLRAAAFFIHAANDYSVAPGKVLADEMQRRGQDHRLAIYPALGTTPAAGHNLIYRSVPTWEADVFAFLDPRMR